MNTPSASKTQSKRHGPSYKSDAGYILGRALLKFRDFEPLMDTHFNGMHYVITKTGEADDHLLRTELCGMVEAVTLPSMLDAYQEAWKVAEWDFKVRGIETEMSKEDVQLIIEAMAGDIADLIRENDNLMEQLERSEERYHEIG